MSKFTLRALSVLAVVFAGLIASAAFEPAAAQSKADAAKRHTALKAHTPHKIAIQVNDNDPRVMNLALNNAANVAEYYKSKGEPVVIEIVTYGPGLHMLRADSSPVKSRIAHMSLELPQVTFAACANTQANMARQEGKDVTLIPEARVVPSGVVRLTELQEKGFAYIRP